jgi:hypothetical protein
MSEREKQSSSPFLSTERTIARAYCQINLQNGYKFASTGYLHLVYLPKSLRNARQNIFSGVNIARKNSY